MKETLLRRVHALFFVMFAVTALVSVLAVRTISRTVASNDWVNQTHSLISELDGMLSSLRSGEGLMRTYAVTEDPRDFAAARGELANVQDHLALARALARAEGEDAAVYTRLEAIADARVQFAESLHAAREAGQADKVRQLLSTDSGSTAPADFGREIERLRTRQFDLLSERDRESYRQAHETRWIVGVGAGVNLLLFVVVALLIRDDLANRRRMTAALEAANASLEQRVLERTAELTATNQRLVAENLERRWTSVSQEHQLRYNQLIVNSVSDLVYVLTKALNVTRVNPAVPRFTGFEEDAILGRPITQFLRFAADPLSPASADAVARNVTAGREIIDAPVGLLDSAGRTHSVTVSVVPLRDNDQVVGAVAVVHRQPSTTPTA